MVTTEQLYELFKAHPRITTDSRAVRGGEIYFALRGEQFDGNQFAAAALQAGAAYAVIDNPTAAIPGDQRYILVENSLLSLQHLAQHHRRQFHILVLAITGSNGKTTTKELVAAVLSSHYRAHATTGNLNNHIGVPLSLLSMPADTEVAIIEMGANHQGEIDMLAHIAMPTHGIITNIGNAHLEGFGGIEGVKKGKSELYKFLTTSKGVALINADEAFLADLSLPVERRILYRQQQQPQADGPYIEIKLLQTHPYIQYAFFNEEGELVQGEAQLSGLHNFRNIMTAVAVGKYFKVPCQKIQAAIAAYLPSNNRSQILVQAGIHFLLDAYNANPNSMAASLESFSKTEATHKAVLLGAMFELGSESPEEHLRIAQLAQSYDFQEVIVVGKEFEAAATALQLRYFQDVDALSHWFWQQNWQDYHVLLKGSRGMRMERLIAHMNTPSTA